MSRAFSESRRQTGGSPVSKNPKQSLSSQGPTNRPRDWRQAFTDSARRHRKLKPGAQRASRGPKDLVNPSPVAETPGRVRTQASSFRSQLASAWSMTLCLKPDLQTARSTTRARAPMWRFGLPNLISFLKPVAVSSAAPSASRYCARRSEVARRRWRYAR
jgi:hypothetical protein